MKSWLLCLLMAWCGVTGMAREPLVRDGAAKHYQPFQPVCILVDSSEPALVMHAARLLQKDLKAVTGNLVRIVHQPEATGRGMSIVLGTLENSRWLRQYQQQGLWKPVIREGQWEACEITSLVKSSNDGTLLLLAGSDRRGAAYAVSGFCRLLGVSPWYWWADVPIEARKQLHFHTQWHMADSPGVRYRGIFINDEAPALSGWAREQFGGFNHRFYEKVFELMVRLKANYLWPAMWGSAFYDDDPQNRQLADDWGIVIGTSHHEPMMRAHDEWRRYGQRRPWHYDSSRQDLLTFWEKGLRRATNEKLVTIGMRGDGDEPMTRETAIGLLQRIVADQRGLIEAVSGKPAEATPQLWALYKEVQDYYDQGMQVPEDVTLLFADDNWGNIRRLPNPADSLRKGGYGIYYHFDYVGGPRNYKWVNTNHISRIWEQMHLAWQYGARRIWMVNVGDIKPMELPTSFFLDMAWRPDTMTMEAAEAYTRSWAVEQFGVAYAGQIAELLDGYTKINSRRKPELLAAQTFNFERGEWQGRTDEYQQLASKVKLLQSTLSDEAQPAFFQLVQHPVEACANLYKLYYHVAANAYWYRQGDTVANAHAREAMACYLKDSLLTEAYHRLNGGKWNHMMSQTHIGYTSWQQPAHQVMPAVQWLDRPVTPPLGQPGAGWCISLPATAYSSQQAPTGTAWKKLSRHSRTGLDALTTWPVTHPFFDSSTAPRLAYDFTLKDTTTCWLELHYSPSLNYWKLPQGMQIAVWFNGRWQATIGVNEAEKSGQVWERWVAANVIKVKLRLLVEQPGKQQLQLAHLHPGLVLQHVLVYHDAWQTYLPPPQGYWENTMINFKK